MYKRGSSRHTWHPTLRALGVAAMQPGGRLDVQEHIRNARSCSLVYKVVGGRGWSGPPCPVTHNQPSGFKLPSIWTQKAVRRSDPRRSATLAGG